MLAKKTLGTPPESCHVESELHKTIILLKPVFTYKDTLRQGSSLLQEAEDNAQEKKKACLTWKQRAQILSPANLSETSIKNVAKMKTLS